MRKPRIYTPQDLAIGCQMTLETQASHHLATVLRMRENSEILLFNGSDQTFDAIIRNINKRKVEVDIVGQTDQSLESPLSIHLGIAISKGDRMEMVIQKATELGITSITPLLSERTHVKLNAERQEKKHQQWQQIAIGACEQCGRNTIPFVRAVTKLERWLVDCEAEEKFVLHHRTDSQLSEIAKPNNIALLIGPEGGLSQEEIDHAIINGFKALSLGPRVLRTETAPLAAISILQHRWGDM